MLTLILAVFSVAVTANEGLQSQLTVTNELKLDGTGTLFRTSATSQPGDFIDPNFDEDYHHAAAPRLAVRDSVNYILDKFVLPTIPPLLIEGSSTSSGTIGTLAEDVRQFFTRKKKTTTEEPC